MSLAPRAVLVHRATEYEELLARHGTHGQAAFFLRSRERRAEEPDGIAGPDDGLDGLDGIAARHARTREALAEVAAAVPLTWRRARVERAELDRFLFAPEDVVIVVGSDGLVANVSKYLAGQPVVGIDADPGRNPGVLVRHGPSDARKLLPAATAPGTAADELTMVEAVTDDGQRLTALNEIYVGAAGHQTARYRIGVGGPHGTGGSHGTGGPGGPGGRGDGSGEAEAQASSGVLVGTGTGASGWLRSVWQERGGRLTLPGRTEERLLWFVREAWPSPVTGTSLVAGELTGTRRLRLTVESDRLVAFGDGIESDALELTWGRSVRVGVCGERLRLVG